MLDRIRSHGLAPGDVADPGDLARELGRDALRYLYRILFLLYAEARPELGILPADDQDYIAGYSMQRLGELADGCDPLAPERVIQLRLAFAPGERWGTCYQVVNALSPVLGLANVRYVLSRSPLPLPRVANIAGYTIFENARVLPRFFFAQRVQAAASLADAAHALHAADFDPRTAIVEAAIPTGAVAPGEVQVVSYAANRIRLRTRSAGDGFLVAGDTWYPGWEAPVPGGCGVSRAAGAGGRSSRGDALRAADSVALGGGVGIGAAGCFMGAYKRQDHLAAGGGMARRESSKT